MKLHRCPMMTVTTFCGVVAALLKKEKHGIGVVAPWQLSAALVPSRKIGPCTCTETEKVHVVHWQRSSRGLTAPHFGFLLGTTTKVGLTIDMLGNYRTRKYIRQRSLEHFIPRARGCIALPRQIRTRASLNVGDTTSDPSPTTLAAQRKEVHRHGTMARLPSTTSMASRQSQSSLGTSTTAVVCLAAHSARTATCRRRFGPSHGGITLRQ